MPTYECPTCHTSVQVAKREAAPYRPFCSERCKLIDLHKWFSEEYRVSEPLLPGSDENEPFRGDQPPGKGERINDEFA